MNDLYPIAENHIAFVTYTDEPVFVIKITKADADGYVGVIVRRAVETPDGRKYEQDEFNFNELSSEKAHVITHLDMTKFQAEQRDRYSREYQVNSKAAALAAGPAIPDGTGYSN